MNVIETVMTEKEWKKHNKEWLEGYVIAATSQKFKRWKRRLNFQKFSGLIFASYRVVYDRNGCKSIYYCIRCGADRVLETIL